ncbi:MAG: DUF6600 domain-containing protein [Chitinophagaceae bacterium]
MKRIFQLAALALVMVLGSSLRNTAAAQYPDQGYDQGYDQGDDQGYGQDRDVSYQTFYDQLSPYGQWVDYPNLGYVWVPDAGSDFRPYSTNGHWVWTDNYEWMWVSDYDWGWAPFHYGRWDNDPSYGWYWVPGYEWSPAWVAWRDGGDYYGWAPIRPGISISINFNIGGYSPPYDFWCFAPRRYITSPRIYDYYLDRRQNVTIINQTNIIVNNFRYGSNYGFRSGPSRYEAERYVGRINPVRFRASNMPGRTQFRNNEVSIYRPQVRRDNNRQVAPRQFERYDRSTARNTDNGFRRNDNVTNRGNNLPDRNDRVNNNPVQGRRDNNDFRQQRSNDAQPDRTTGDRRMNSPVQGTAPQPGNNDRRFDRQNNNTGNNSGHQSDTRNNDVSQRRPQQIDRRQEQPQPQQQQQPMPRQTDRRQNDQPQQQQRQFDRRQNDQPRVQAERQPQQQMERRQPQAQPQQQVERRQPQPQPQQQVERRQEQRQQPQAQPQQQPRQMERRDDSRQQESNDGNNGKGNGNGRKRF